MTSNNRLKPIVVQYAMRIEAQPLLDHFGLTDWKPLIPEFPFQVYRSQLESGRDLVIVLAGVEERFGVDAIGGIPAALLGFQALREIEPGILINAGTAGGFESNGDRIGEVFSGRDVVCFHARRCEIPGMKEMGLGRHRLPDTSKIAAHLGIRRAIISSGDSLDCSADDLRLIQENEATLKEMEAGPLGWVCEKLKVPLLPIKSVTDLVDHASPTHEQFLKNYGIAVHELTRVVTRAIEYLDRNQSDPVWTVRNSR